MADQGVAASPPGSFLARSRRPDLLLGYPDPTERDARPEPALALDQSDQFLTRHPPRWGFIEPIEPGHLLDLDQSLRVIGVRIFPAVPSVHGTGEETLTGAEEPGVQIDSAGGFLTSLPLRRDQSKGDDRHAKEATRRIGCQGDRAVPSPFHPCLDNPPPTAPPSPVAGERRVGPAPIRPRRATGPPTFWFGGWRYSGRTAKSTTRRENPRWLEWGLALRSARCVTRSTEACRASIS